MPKGYPNSGLPRRIPPDRRCQICKHADRARIEALHLAGVSLDKIAGRFGVHRDSIHRHCRNHLNDEQRAQLLIGPGRFAELAEIACEESTSLVEWLGVQRSVLFAQFLKAAERNNPAEVAALSGRISETLRDLGKLTGEVSAIAGKLTINVNSHTSVAVMTSEPFVALQDGLVRLCVAHPNVRDDIMRLLTDLDDRFSASPQSKVVELQEVTRAR